MAATNLAAASHGPQYSPGIFSFSGTVSSSALCCNNKNRQSRTENNIMKLFEQNSLQVPDYSTANILHLFILKNQSLLTVSTQNHGHGHGQ